MILDMMTLAWPKRHEFLYDNLVFRMYILMIPLNGNKDEAEYFPLTSH